MKRIGFSVLQWERMERLCYVAARRLRGDTYADIGASLRISSSRAEQLLTRWVLHTCSSYESELRHSRSSVGILDLPVSCLSLSMRAHNACESAHLTTIGQIVELGSDRLPRQANCGKRTLVEIEQSLAVNGLTMTRGTAAQAAIDRAEIARKGYMELRRQVLESLRIIAAKNRRLPKF